MRTAAAVAYAPNVPLTLTELVLDEPRANEVQVRMVASGVCHTDAIVRDQWYPTPLPAVLGHEGAGIVVAVGGGVTDIAVDDHVLLSFHSCGVCANCTAGHPAYCEVFFASNFGGRRDDGSTAFTDDDGVPVSSGFFGQSSFAAYANVSARSVVRVDPAANLQLLAPLGCGIQTGAGAILNVLQPEAGSSIVIFGAGAVGMSALLAAVIQEAAIIIVVDVVPGRLVLARELGATHVIDGSAIDAVDEIWSITGSGARYALDTTGVPAVFEQMTRSLGVLGSGALVGAAALGTRASIDIGTLMPTGISIRMIVEGDSDPTRFVPELVALHAEGRFPFDRLVTAYPFAEINSAFDDSASGLTLKPVVVFD
jgi:aryl-alcohol dehydrogenase